MNADLVKYKRFTYRGCPGMCCFNVAELFIYMITETHITQITKHSAVSCSKQITFKPISTIIHDNLIYMISPKGLAYFDGNLYEICHSEPLSISFVSGPFVYTVAENRISVFSTEEKKIYLVLSINGVKGCCTAAHSTGSSAYLGYETGKVYLIENLNNISINRESNILETHQIGDLEEPILSIATFDIYIYTSTISGKIARICKDEKTFIHTEVGFAMKKILFYENLLVGFENSTIVLYDLDLKLLHSFVEYFAITDMFVLNDSLYLGYSIGLVTEYDIAKIKKSITGGDIPESLGC
ncbi:hypothetical protein PAEPH01_1320 [Pancytospora epiphaga]|nr:hypothetical protein PAEPH01_1320 [Pancytospora epiphaga]